MCKDKEITCLLLFLGACPLILEVLILTSGLYIATSAFIYLLNSTLYFLSQPVALPTYINFSESHGMLPVQQRLLFLNSEILILVYFIRRRFDKSIKQICHGG